MQNRQAHFGTDSLEQPPSLLADLYAQPAFEAGYTRGANDTLARMLESADEFARLKPESMRQTLAVLFAFSRFLENKLSDTPQPHRAQQDQTFFDGSGI